MNIELKQAAQRALLALRSSQPHPSNPFIGLTDKDFIDHKETIRQLRNALQQAAHTTQTDVTDEQIAACVKRASTYGVPFVGLLNPGGAPSEFSKRFTAEILALRPVQVPMTDEERKLAAIDWSPCVRAAFNAGVKAAERHHDITAQTKKEAP